MDSLERVPLSIFIKLRRFSMAIVGACLVPHPPLIVAEVGRGEEKIVQKTIDSYQKMAKKIAEKCPGTIVLSSPHSILYSDYFHISPGKGAKGSFSSFGAGQVTFEVRYDQELVQAIEKRAKKLSFPAGTLGERDPRLDHGTMVPLYFIEKEVPDFLLVRLSLSGLSLADHYRLGQLIEEEAERLGRRVFYVASGDLSHKMEESGPYGYDPAGPVYDQKVMDVLGRADFKELLEFPASFCEKAAECGHRSICIMAGALDKKSVKTEVFSHQGLTGVGYGLVFYDVLGEDPSRNFLDQWVSQEKEKLQKKREKEDPYLTLARETVETYVLNGQPDLSHFTPPSELLKNRAGVFVSLHKEGELRGCIGTIDPVRTSLFEEIISNAISACSGDPRFSPVQPEELAFLEYCVDVLEKPEPVSSMDQLDAKEYGVIVSRGGRRGLLLPNLDGVNTPEEQIAIARRKAGIGKNEEVDLERFRVIRHE